MASFVHLGRETSRGWLLVCLAPLVFSCNPKVDPGISSTPVPTPIVIGTPSLSGTPSVTTSPTPAAVVNSNAERHELLERVREVVEASRAVFPGDTGVCFIDIVSDQKIEFEAEKKFESASLMKLVVIAEVFRRVQIGEMDLDQTLTLKAEQIVGGSGDLKNLEPGTAFPVRVLTEKMITQSDNTATQMLTDYLTKEALGKSTKNLGLTGTTIDRDVYDFAAIDQGRDNYITARDAGLLMEQLAREELPGSKEIHTILERQQRNDMIGSGLAQGVRIAHKTGELNGILHDVGIVYAPRGSYVLVLLSDNVSDKDLAIKEFSRLSQSILKLYTQEPPTPSPSSSPSPTP